MRYQVYEEHTVKLVDIMNDRLEDSTATWHMLVKALLFRFLLVELEDHRERREDKGHDDGKRAISPAPSRGSNEGLTSQGTGEGSADEGRTDEGKGKRTIVQAGGIGNEDIKDKVEGIISDPVEDVAGSISVRPIAGSQDDQTKDIDKQKKEVALRTAPDVQGLRNGELEHTADNGG